MTSLVGSITLALVGLLLIYLSDYTHVRAIQTDGYNFAVDSWTDHALAEFNETSWELLIDGQAIPMVPLSEVELKDKDTKTVETYSPLKYVLPVDIPALIIPTDQASDESPVEIFDSDGKIPAAGPDRDNATAVELMRVREISIVVRDNGGEPQTIQLEPTPLLKQFIRQSSGWKVCKYQQGGYFSGRTHSCTTYQVLDHLCVKVKRAVNGTWGLDATYGGEGCSYITRWSQYTWRRVNALPNGHSPRLPEYIKRIFPSATVRSSEDPVILAMNLTQGKLVLAESEGEEWATGLILIIIGAVTILPAVFLAWPVYKALRAKKRREAYFVRQVDEVELEP